MTIGRPKGTKNKFGHIAGNKKGCTFENRKKRVSTKEKKEVKKINISLSIEDYEKYIETMEEIEIKYIGKKIMFLIDFYKKNRR